MDGGIPQMTPVGGSAANLGADVAKLAPLASSWSGASTGVATQQVVKEGYTAQGNLAKFGSFLGNLGSETGHLVTGASKWLVTQGKNMVTSVPRDVAGVSHLWTDNQATVQNMKAVQTQTKQWSDSMTTLQQQYKSGAINHEQYVSSMKDIAANSNKLVDQNQALNAKIATDKAQATKAWIDTASAAVTVMTAGTDAIAMAAAKVAGEGAVTGISETGLKSAAMWLASDASKPMLEPVAGLINKIATNPTLFKALDTVMQGALQKATAEVVTQSAANITAGQIARATAVNVALKYPLTFNYISSTAQSLYTELNTGKYGPAFQQIGFNALLLLSGGPIGLAVKGIAKGAEVAALKTFGETSFWDQLSTHYGEGNTDGFSKAITKVANSEELLAQHGYTGADARAQFIKDLSAVEHTNVGAVHGDVAAGAGRVANGMQSQYSFDLKTIDHETALLDMAKMAKNYRAAAEWGAVHGMPNIAVGRGDARDLSSIANIVGQGDTIQQKLDNWEVWKNNNQHTAFANNDNFDKQIQQIINNGGDTHGEILKIKAATSIAGFPQALSDQMAKDGYIAIAPNKNAAPFVEGKDSLTTKFIAGGESTRGGGQDFFTKAVQPLPVLGSVGTMMTKMGLSPFASSERTYQIFNDNVARNLSETSVGQRIQTILNEGVTKTAPTEVSAAEKAGMTQAEYNLAIKQGFTPEMLAKGHVEGEAPKVEAKAAAPTKSAVGASDYMLKQLSNYAHGLKLPVGDFRLLTNKQIRKALESYQLTFSEASDIQNAIAKAHIQVPWAVKGLGPAVVDKTFGLTGVSAIARRYTRIQTELRFTINPFYQYLRLIPKTEILTTAEGGGAVKAIFSGRWSEIPKIREGLREAGMFDKAATTFGGGLTGEAASMLGSGSKNLGKKLLPAQEASIAGLIDAQAQKMGMNWEEYIHNYPQQAADTVQMIAEYNRNSQFLNSPLAKTLNIAFFPFRFDAKVAGIMARSLGRQELMVQVAVVHGLLQANDWMKTPQGEAWYSQNATAIGLFKYITPLATLNEVFQSLVPGHDHSLGNFGELGGLPFGWLPMITDQAGLTQFNQTGVDAKTGAAIPSYVPATTKGAAAIAIQDLLGMLFSYPGATVGLPSKTSITRSAALGLVGGSKSTDLKLVTPQLTPEQQQYQKNVQAANGGVPGMLPTPQQPIQQPIKMPSQQAPITVPVPKKSGGAGKKKKSQFIPAQLPNQGQVGL